MTPVFKELMQVWQYLSFCSGYLGNLNIVCVIQDSRCLQHNLKHKVKDFLVLAQLSYSQQTAS